MSDANSNRRLGRSIGAVLAGFVLIFVSSLGTDVILHATGVFPPWGQPMSEGLYVLASIYRALYAVVACAITARLAPRAPLAHALALGALGVVVSSLGAAATWDMVPALGPRWYPLHLIAVSLPLAWLGGRLEAALGRSSATAQSAA